MAKLRLQFAKEGRAVYMSHLDLMRTFQRVFLRRGVVVRHSQGYHPHPILSFAVPLPVGQESECELLDFELEGVSSPAALAEELTPFCPEGIRPIRCGYAVRPISELAYLRCRVELLYDGGLPAGGGEKAAELLEGESLVVQKRTKHKELTGVDIRPMLKSFTIEDEPDRLVLHTVVAAQNPGLNPALLAAAVGTYLPDLKPDFVRVKRLETLDGQGRTFLL